MNRRILIQVTSPAALLGLVLLGACLAGAWYSNRVERNLSDLRNESLVALQTAQELEIYVRQLRFHCFVYLIDPSPARLKPIDEDEQNFTRALRAAEQSARTDEERTYVREIETGYQQYRNDLARLRAEVSQGRRFTDLSRLADAHPVRFVVKPCQDLLGVSEARIRMTLQESDRAGRQARLALLFLGVGGPLGGLLFGYAIARGLSRSLYQLSVRVQGMAQRLDQDVASVSVAADGDLGHLDSQLAHVVRRVEEVAERVQRHQHEMLRAEQLSAVGQLAASVAHEVRNPLTSVKLLVDAALRDQDRKMLSDEDLQVIHGEIVRLERTVQNFLDFARPPLPRRSPADLRELIRDAAGLVRARARQQHVEIALECGDLPLERDVDADQLRTVFVNLFLNALDAMPRGGKLEVTLEGGPDEEACFRVVDSGTGIPPAISERLFTPFASSKPTGTGLGLSISRRIVEEHGGSISAANRPDGGACFTITLPANGQRSAECKEKC